MANTAMAIIIPSINVDVGATFMSKDADGGPVFGGSVELSIDYDEDSESIYSRLADEIRTRANDATLIVRFLGAPNANTY